MKNKGLLIPFLLTGLLFAGCNKDGDYSSSSEPPASSQPAPSVDYTVTKTEFMEAMNLYHKNLTYKCFEKYGDEEATEEVHMKFLADGSSHQAKAGGWGNFYWQALPDGKVYQISKYQENYYVTKIRTLAGYESGNYGDDLGYIGYIDDTREKYDELTYDATTHSYKGSIEFEYPPMSLPVEVKFENKKLISFTLTQEYMGETMVASISVFDYGTTVIDFDALHYTNDFYVSGRKFAFKTSESDLEPEEEASFNSANATSYIQFNQNETFSMYVHYDYQTSAPKTYTGTYEFSIQDSDVYLSLHYDEGNRTQNANFMVSYNTHRMGAELIGSIKMNSTQDIYLRFANPVAIS